MGRGEERGDQVVAEEPCKAWQGPAALGDQQVVELVGGAGPEDVGRLGQADVLAQVAALLEEAGVVAGALLAEVVVGLEQRRHVGVAGRGDADQPHDRRPHRGELAVHDPSLRGQLLEVAGPENLTLTQLANRLIAASGKPGRTRRVPLPLLRTMAVLARPLSPVFARQAQAAVVMNTTDMTVDVSAIRDRFPTIPASTLDEVISRQPPLKVPGAGGDTPSRSGKQAPLPSSSEPPASSTG